MFAKKQMSYKRVTHSSYFAPFLRAHFSPGPKETITEKPGGGVVHHVLVSYAAGTVLVHWSKSGSYSKGRRVLSPELQWQSTSVLKKMTSLLPNHEEA